MPHLITFHVPFPVDRLKRPVQRKKYGLLSNYDDSVEMEAVESDEDDTLYEARSLRRSEVNTDKLHVHISWLLSQSGCNVQTAATAARHKRHSDSVWRDPQRRHRTEEQEEENNCHTFFFWLPENFSFFLSVTVFKLWGHTRKRKDALKHTFCKMHQNDTFSPSRINVVWETRASWHSPCVPCTIRVIQCQSNPVSE